MEVGHENNFLLEARGWSPSRNIQILKICLFHVLIHISGPELAMGSISTYDNDSAG